MKPPDAILGGLNSKKEKIYLQNTYLNLSSRTCFLILQEQKRTTTLIFISVNLQRK